MAYPDIFPIEPGNDGWTSAFNSSAKRLLHHCGLTLHEGGVWKLDAGKRIPDWAATQETRPIKVTVMAVSHIVRRVCALYGLHVGHDILKVHGNVSSVMALRPKHFAAVYVACQAKLNAAPEPRQLPPPQKRPYA